MKERTHPPASEETVVPVSIADLLQEYQKTGTLPSPSQPCGNGVAEIEIRLPPVTTTTQTISQPNRMWEWTLRYFSIMLPLTIASGTYYFAFTPHSSVAFNPHTNLAFCIFIGLLTTTFGIPTSAIALFVVCSMVLLVYGGVFCLFFGVYYFIYWMLTPIRLPVAWMARRILRARRHQAHGRHEHIVPSSKRHNIITALSSVTAVLVLVFIALSPIGRVVMHFGGNAGSAFWMAFFHPEHSIYFKVVSRIVGKSG